jgi:hypothetical protein
MAGKPQARQAIVQPLDKPYRFIALTQGKVAIVDAADFDFLSQWNWRAQPSRGLFYVTRNGPRVHGGKRATIFMHEILLPCESGKKPDHKNRNPLDNRRENLRPSTHAQNKANGKKQRNNTSGFKGVSLEKRRGSWIAYIKLNQKRIYLGSFASAQQAAVAYDIAAIKYFGEFANTNSDQMSTPTPPT